MKEYREDVILAKDFLTVREVAMLLDCSVRTVYRMIENNDINAFNLNKRMTRIKRTELERLIAY